MTAYEFAPVVQLEALESCIRFTRSIHGGRLNLAIVIIILLQDWYIHTYSASSLIICVQSI